MLIVELFNVTTSGGTRYELVQEQEPEEGQAGAEGCRGKGRGRRRMAVQRNRSLGDQAAARCR
ncbi:hypothetical protein ABTO92_19700, partial [Acinetobacter baumannii]